MREFQICFALPVHQNTAGNADSRLYLFMLFREPNGPPEGRTMNQPIRTHEVTGQKIFNTRAAKASEKIAGKGYSPVADQSLITLPPPPPGAAFNAEEQAKYREFKEARRGAADYMAMEGEFSRYLEDVYSAPPVAREALTDSCEIVVVGAGFAGL